MADEEAENKPVAAKPNANEELAPEPVSEPEPDPWPTMDPSPPPMTDVIYEKPNDFWICLGLLVIFGIVCAIGFVVLRFTVYSGGKSDDIDPKWKEQVKLLCPRRMKALHGLVNYASSDKAPPSDDDDPCKM